MINCILFDLDGTLADSGEGVIKSSVYALNHFGIEVSEDELKTFIGPPLRVSFMKQGLSAENAEKALEYYRERYIDVGIYENKPYNGIKDCLESLKSKGYRLFVATSKPENMALHCLEHFGLAKYFEGIIGASLDNSRDTKEGVIEHLLKNYDIKKPIMVGDTIYDVLGAKQFGINTIGVSWGYGKKEDLISSGAIKIADTMDQLISIIADL